jgi:hypothetical protein
MSCCSCFVSPVNQGICLINCGCKYVGTCIGVPSQTAGGNPNTTTAPGTSNNNPTFLNGLTGIATKAFAGIAGQAELSAQQSIAKATGTTSISGYASTSIWVILIGLGVLAYFLLKGK